MFMKMTHGQEFLSAAESTINSTTNMLRFYSPVQLVFGCDMILPIKYKVDWELIHQQKKRKINKYSIQKYI